MITGTKMELVQTTLAATDLVEDLSFMTYFEKERKASEEREKEKKTFGLIRKVINILQAISSYPDASEMLRIGGLALADEDEQDVKLLGKAMSGVSALAKFANPIMIPILILQKILDFENKESLRDEQEQAQEVAKQKQKGENQRSDNQRSDNQSAEEDEIEDQLRKVSLIDQFNKWFPIYLREAVNTSPKKQSIHFQDEEDGEDVFPHTSGAQYFLEKFNQHQEQEKEEKEKEEKRKSMTEQELQYDLEKERIENLQKKVENYCRQLENIFKPAPAYMKLDPISFDTKTSKETKPDEKTSEPDKELYLLEKAFTEALKFQSDLSQEEAKLALIAHQFPHMSVEDQHLLKSYLDRTLSDEDSFVTKDSIKSMKETMYWLKVKFPHKRLF